jgi:5'-methylthioadenosine phosphorylase
MRSNLNLEPIVRTRTHEEVVRVFQENNEKLRDLLFAMIPRLPSVRDCACATALEGARFEV